MRNSIIAVAGIFLLTSITLLFSQHKPSLSPTTSPTSIPKSASITPQNASDVPQTAIFAEHLDVPWAIAFMPDKRMLVTERPGRVRIVDASGLIEPIPAAILPVHLEPDGEGGLLGITLHPHFDQNHFVYLYYTFASGARIFNKVVRMTFENSMLSNERIIVDNIPAAIYHDGGRIKFGPDGYLYITTGDSRNSALAQDRNSLAGKILRVTDEGQPAPGNPFGNPVYTYGHRNPEGLAWSNTGALWETEHGRSNPTGFDELNLIQSGKNYGWEIIQGDETKSGLETPKKNSGATTTWAPSGAAFVGNSLFFAGLKGQTLYEAIIQNNQVIDFKEHLIGQFGRLREVILGPDGMLYITTSNRDGRGNPQEKDDRIIRVNPQKL